MTDSARCPQCGALLAAENAPQGLCPQCLLKAGLESTGGGEPLAATVADAPVLEEIAKEFPQLEILSLIGQGGMGIVYRARQPHLDRLVALKVLPAQRQSDPAYHERFVREARALAKLSHPNIVGIHDFGRTPSGRPYFLMEFIDGVNLREALRGGHLSPQQALTIVPQICDALQFAHDEGIVHRDIKPENVLLDRKGRVKIADFGIAKILGRETGSVTLTQTGQTVGTPRYMAPEQLEHPEEVDHRADIYSLGVVFYEMLTGELPMGRFQTPSQRVHVDVRLDEVVLRALEREPERRYQQASEVKTRVETIAGTSPPPQPAPAPELPPHVVYRRWRHRMMLTPGREHLRRALLAGGLLICIGFLNMAREATPPVAMSRDAWAQAQILLWAFGWLGLVLAILSRRIASVGLTVEEQQHVADLRRQAREAGMPRVLIWGIAVFVLSLALVTGMFILTGPVSRGMSSGPVEGVLILPGRMLLLLAAAGPLAMTACGLAGLSLIRHSNFRRPGLGLALFEVLAVPLLMLDCLLVWAIKALGDLTVDAGVRWSTALPLGLLLSLVIDFFLVRWAWRAAKRGDTNSTNQAN